MTADERNERLEVDVQDDADDEPDVTGPEPRPDPLEEPSHPGATVAEKLEKERPVG